MYEQHQQNHHRHHHYSDNPTFAIPTSQQDELSMTYSQFVFDDQTLAALDTQDLGMKYMQLLESSNHEIENEPRQLSYEENNPSSLIPNTTSTLAHHQHPQQQQSFMQPPQPSLPQQHNIQHPQHTDQYTTNLDQSNSVTAPTSTDFYNLDHVSATMLPYSDDCSFQQPQHHQPQSTFDHQPTPSSFYPFGNVSSDNMSFQPPFPPTDHYTSNLASHNQSMPIRQSHPHPHLHHHHTQQQQQLSHQHPHQHMGPSSIASSSSTSSLSSSSSFAHVADQRPQIYVRKACVSCKQSHVACDVQRPCSRCVRLNKSDTCVDAERKKRGRPCGSGKKKREAAAAAAAASMGGLH